MSGDSLPSTDDSRLTTLAATALSMDEKPGKESRHDHKTVVDTFPKSYRVLSLAGLSLCCPQRHAAAFCSPSDLTYVAGAYCYTIRDITRTYTAENHFLNTHCQMFNPLNSELNPIRHLLALVGARHIVHVSRIRVNTNVLWDMTPCNLIGTDFSRESTAYMFNVDFCGT